MKKIKNKIGILILSLTVFACSTVKKESINSKLMINEVGENTIFKYVSRGDRENNSSKFESQKLLSKEFEMILPVPFRMQKENYEEGVIYFYIFTDSTNIIVFEGTMMKFPIDNYEPDKTVTINQRKISVGLKNNTNWRKDVIEGIRVYYDNVSSENKLLYDEILDSIKIKPLMR